MDLLETLRTWLLTWPGWEPGAKLCIDYTDTVPGSCGLVSSGIQELSRREDVLGNVQVQCRWRGTVYRTASRDADAGDNQRWAQALQLWVQQQNVRGSVPSLGEKTTLRAERGRLVKPRQPGNVLQAVELTAEFIRKYEEDHNG